MNSYWTTLKNCIEINREYDYFLRDKKKDARRRNNSQKWRQINKRRRNAEIRQKKRRQCRVEARQLAKKVQESLVLI